MSVAIIDVNDVFFDTESISQARFEYDVISETICDFISIKNINNTEDDIMKILISELELTENNFTIHTGEASYVNDELYQICHILLTKESYNTIKSKNIKYNGIASYLSDTTLKVYGKAILIKYNTFNDENKLETIIEDNIINLFISKFVHKGVIVSPNESVSEIKFIYNPIDWVTVSESEKYKYYELEIYEKILMVFFDKSLENNRDVEKNKNVSDLLNQDIYGKAIIALRNQFLDMTDNNIVYSDLDSDTYKKMISIVKNKLNNNKTGNNKVDDIINDINSKKKMTNFYKLLNSSA
jgi:hypothetical protein